MEMCFFIICNECPKSDQKGPLCGEPQRFEILRDDSPWDGEGFRLKSIRIRRTVSWKIACIVVLKIACILATLAVNVILFSMNLQRIWEVGRGWGD